VTEASVGGHFALFTVMDWVRSLWPFGRHLIFPERRSGTRVLTLKNAVRAAIVFVAAFLLLSLWSAFRPAHRGASLWESRTTSADAPAGSPASYPVVPEGSIRSYPQEVAIGSDLPTAPAQPVIPRQNAPRGPQPQPRLGTGQRITISGGSEGVQLHVEPAPAATATRPE